MPTESKPETIEVQPAQAVDPAAICSALVWTTDKPTVPGWYWLKAPNLSPRIDKFSHPGWDKTHCYCPYTGGDILNLHGRPYMYAGPINEPNVPDQATAKGKL